ncbi:MAG: hypothetical protein ACI4T5_10460 [Prevotella sp.]
MQRIMVHFVHLDQVFVFIVGNVPTFNVRRTEMFDSVVQKNTNTSFKTILFLLTVGQNAENA